MYGLGVSKAGIDGVEAGRTGFCSVSFLSSMLRLWAGNIRAPMPNTVSVPNWLSSFRMRRDSWSQLGWLVDIARI